MQKCFFSPELAHFVRSRKHLLDPQEQVLLFNFALSDALQVDAILCLYFDGQLDNCLIPCLRVRPLPSWYWACSLIDCHMLEQCAQAGPSCAAQHGTKFASSPLTQTMKLKSRFFPALNDCYIYKLHKLNLTLRACGSISSVNFITTLRQISQLFAKYLRIAVEAQQTLRPFAFTSLNRLIVV